MFPTADVSGQPSSWATEPGIKIAKISIAKISIARISISRIF
jgi:hypothetical protein